MSLKRRLEQLEGSGSAGEVPEHRRVQMKEYLNEMARANGEEPEPLTEQEKRISIENERRWLEEGIPRYRREPGWDTPQCQAILDQWEAQSRERLQEESDE